MPWTRLDDHFHSNPKILGLSHAAFRLYVVALNWSVSELTDGKVPDYMPSRVLSHESLRTRRHAAGELVEQNLWHVFGAGWEIHDFALYQETSSKVRERRSKWAGQKRGQRHMSTVDNSPDSMSESPPDPVRERDARPGIPIPIPNDSPSLSQLTEQALELWAELQNTKPTERWRSTNRARAMEFMKQHPEISWPELDAFLRWARENGCFHVGGWPGFWPSFPEASIKPVLPDCEICDNRRLVPTNDEWTEMKPCRCTQ